MDRTIWAIFPDACADHEVCRADQSASVDNGAKPQAHTFQFKIKWEGEQSPRFALFNLQASVNDMVKVHLCQILAALAGDQREIHRQAEPRRHCLRGLSTATPDTVDFVTNKLKLGAVVIGEFKRARNPGLHRKFFSLLNLGLNTGRRLAAQYQRLSVNSSAGISIAWRAMLTMLACSMRRRTNTCSW